MAARAVAEGRLPDGAGPAERVAGFLLALGADPAEVELARREDRLDLLVVDCILFPDGRRYTALEVSDLTGIPPDELRRLWLALGLPDVGDDDPVFTEMDVEAATTLEGLLLLRMMDDEVAVQLTRVIGSCMARIAEAQISTTPVARGEADPASMAELFALSADATLPGIARLLEYAWRRHLRAAARRAMLARGRHGPASAQVDLTIGFADLVGFTRMSQELSAGELSRLIGRFEALAHDTVARQGGRVVKMIGDEVMYAVDDVGQGVETGLALSEACSGDELLSDLRVGVAYGPVLTRDGDCYGTVVNLASRIVGIALPGSVLVSESVHGALAGREGLSFSPLRPRTLKDLGRVRLYRLRRRRDR